jgi:hypothetical protein
MKGRHVLCRCTHLFACKSNSHMPYPECVYYPYTMIFPLLTPSMRVLYVCVTDCVTVSVASQIHRWP